MLGIPFPPMPHLGGNVNIALSVCAGVAAIFGATLLWGRVLGRFVLAIGMGGLAFLLADPLAARLNVEPEVAKVCVGAAVAILCFLLDRLMWAVAMAALLEIIVLATVVGQFLPHLSAESAPVFDAEQAATFAGWWTALCAYSANCFNAVRASNFSTLVLITIPVALLPAFIAFVRPRVITLIMTGLVGAAGLTGTLWVAAVQVRPRLWPTDWTRLLIPLGVMLVLAIIGWVYQGHSLALAIQAAEKKKTDTEQKAKTQEKASKARTSQSAAR